MSAGSPHTGRGTCTSPSLLTSLGREEDLLLFHFYIAGKGIRPLLDRFTVGCKVDPTYLSSKAGASSHAASLEAASDNHALRLLPPLLMNEAGMPWRPPGGVGGSGS